VLSAAVEDLAAARGVIVGLSLTLAGRSLAVNVRCKRPVSAIRVWAAASTRSQVVLGGQDTGGSGL
jgi:hypothetical protein